MTDLDSIPRYVYWGVQPKVLQNRSLRKLQAARRLLREIAELWDEVVNTPAQLIDSETLGALDAVVEAIHDAVDYLHEPIDPIE